MPRDIVQNKKIPSTFLWALSKLAGYPSWAEGEIGSSLGESLQRLMDLAITVKRHQTKSFLPGERRAFACVLLQSPGAKSAQCWVSQSKDKGAGYFAWDSHSQALWAFPWSEANASNPCTQLCVCCKEGELCCLGDAFHIPRLYLTRDSTSAVLPVLALECL